MASRAGVIGNLPWQRGTSQPGVRMAPRGPQHKEAITAELKIQIQKRVYFHRWRSLVYRGFVFLRFFT